MDKEEMKAHEDRLRQLNSRLEFLRDDIKVMLEKSKDLQEDVTDKIKVSNFNVACYTFLSMGLFSYSFKTFDNSFFSWFNVIIYAICIMLGTWTFILSIHNKNK